jgi:nitrous oxidase accessory protein NosD
VRADPNPGDRVRSQPAERAIVISNANTKAIFASLQSAEVKGRMLRVATPQFIVLDCQVSDIGRKGVEQCPEALRCN